MVQILSRERNNTKDSEIPPTAVGGWFKSALFISYQEKNKLLGARTINSLDLNEPPTAVGGIQES
jgi:hypothetical protein